MNLLVNSFKKHVFLVSLLMFVVFQAQAEESLVVVIQDPMTAAPVSVYESDGSSVYDDRYTVGGLRDTDDDISSESRFTNAPRRGYGGSMYLMILPNMSVKNGILIDRKLGHVLNAR